MKSNNHVQILGKLGEGSYGCVYKAQIVQTGQMVAIKVIELTDED
jgi:serine/threonine protein kinase